MYSIHHSGMDHLLKLNLLINGVSKQLFKGLTTAYFVQLGSMADLVGADRRNA